MTLEDDSDTNVESLAHVEENIMTAQNCELVLGSDSEYCETLGKTIKIYPTSDVSPLTAVPNT